MEGSTPEGFQVDGKGLELINGGEESGGGAEAHEELDNPQGRLTNLNPNNVNSPGITSQLAAHHVCVTEAITTSFNKDCIMSSMEAHNVFKNESCVKDSMYLNYHMSDLGAHTSMRTNEQDANTSSGKQKEGPPIIRREYQSENRYFDACKDQAANSSIILTGEQYCILDESMSTAGHLTCDDPKTSIFNGKARDIVVESMKDKKGVVFGPVSTFSSVCKDSCENSLMVPLSSLVTAEGQNLLVREEREGDLQMVGDEPVKDSSTGIAQEQMTQLQTSDSDPKCEKIGHALVAEVDRVKDDQHGLIKQFPKKVLDGSNGVGASNVSDNTSLIDLSVHLPSSSTKAIPMTRGQLACTDVCQDDPNISTILKKRNGDGEQGNSSKRTKVLHGADIVHVSEHGDNPAEDLSQSLTDSVLSYERSPSVGTRSIIESAKSLAGNPAPQKQFLEVSHTVPVSAFGVDLAEMHGNAEVWTEQLQFADSCLTFSDPIIVEHNIVDEQGRIFFQGKSLEVLDNSLPSEVPLKLLTVEGKNSEAFGDPLPSEVPLKSITVSVSKISEAFSNPLPSEDPLNVVTVIEAVAEKFVQGVESKPKEPGFTGVKDLPDKEEPFLQAVVSPKTISETLKNVSQVNDLGNNISECVIVKALPFDSINKGVSLVETRPACSISIHVIPAGDATLDAVISHSAGDSIMHDPESSLQGLAVTDAETETPSLQGFQDEDVCDPDIKECENTGSPVAGIPDSGNLQGEKISFEAEVAIEETENPSLQGLQDEDVCHSDIKECENTASPVAGIPDSGVLQGEKLSFKTEVAEHQKTSSIDTNASLFINLDEATSAGNASELLDEKCCNSHSIQLDLEVEKTMTSERADEIKKAHMGTEYSEVDKPSRMTEVCKRADAAKSNPMVNEYLEVDTPRTMSHVLPLASLELRDAIQSLGLTMQGVCVPSLSKDLTVLPPTSEKIVLQPLTVGPPLFSEGSKDFTKELTAATVLPQSFAPAPMEVDLFFHASELKISRPPLVFPDHNIREVPLEAFLGHRPVTDAQQVQLRSQILIYGALLQGVLPEESYMALAFMDTRAATQEIGKIQNTGMWERTWQIAAKSQNKFINTKTSPCENHKRAVLSSMPGLPSVLLDATSKAPVATASLSSVSPSMFPSAVRSSVFDVRFSSNAGLRSFPISSLADNPMISNLGIRSNSVAPLQTPSNVVSAAVRPAMLHSEFIRGLAGFQAPFAESWPWGVGSYVLQPQALPSSVPLSSASWWTSNLYPRPPVLGSEVRSAVSTLGSVDQAPQGVTTNMGSSLPVLSPFVKSTSVSYTGMSNADPGNSGKGARARRTRLEARSRKRMKSDSSELPVASEGGGAPSRFKESSVLQGGQSKKSSEPPTSENLRVMESAVASSLEVTRETAFKHPVCSRNSPLISEAIDSLAERSSWESAVPCGSVETTKGGISEAASAFGDKSSVCNSCIAPIESFPEHSSFAKGVECTGKVNNSFCLEGRNANRRDMPMELMLAVGQSSQMQAIRDVAVETPIRSSLTALSSSPDIAKETIPTSKHADLTLQNNGDGGTPSACRSGKPVTEAGNLEEAKLLAENIEIDASSALQISQSFWNDLYSQKNADRGFDKDAEVAFLAVTITAAVSALKAAAAAGKVAYEAAIQAKDIASELFKRECSTVSAGASKDPKDLHTNTMPCIDIAQKTAAERVEAASLSSKKAHILDGVVQAIELAAKAASQAGAIITLGDPIPLSLRSLQESGLDAFLKSRATIGGIRMGADLLKGIHSQQEMGTSLTESQTKAVDGLMGTSLTEIQTKAVDGLLASKVLEAGASSGKEEHERSPQKNMAKRGQNATGLQKKRTEDAQERIEDSEVQNISMPTNSMTATTRSEAITAVAELILEAEEEKLRQTRESTFVEQENVRRIAEGIKENVAVEVIQEEDGSREGWFKARVRKVDSGNVLVVYDDLYDDEEDCQLEEWVRLPASMHDPPRVRLLKDERTRKRRSTIGNLIWLIGDRVDALLNDGWWEGVVKSVNEEDEKLVTVKFPDEETMVMKSWNLRPALTWRDGCWVPWTLQDYNKKEAAGNTLNRQKSQKGFMGVHLRDNAKLSPQTKPVVTETRTSKGRQTHEVVLGVKNRSVQERRSQKGGSVYENNQKNMPQKGSNVKGTIVEVSKVIFGVPKPTKKRKSMIDIEKAQPMDPKGMKGLSKNDKKARGEKRFLSSGDEKREQTLGEGVQADGQKDVLRVKSKSKNSKADSIRHLLPRIRGVATTVSIHGSSTKSSNMVVKKKLGSLGVSRNPSSHGVGVSKRMVLRHKDGHKAGKSLPYHFKKQLDNLERLQKTSEKAETGSKNDDYRRSSRILHPSFKLLEGLQSASKATKKDGLPH